MRLASAAASSIILLTALTSVEAARTQPMMVTDLVWSIQGDAYDTEADNVYAKRQLDFDPHRSAVVLIDVWDEHPNDGFKARMADNVRRFLEPAVDAARRAGMHIIHANSSAPIHPALLPIRNEKVLDYRNEIDDGKELADYLHANDIRTVFYAGYAANACIIGKPAAMLFVIHLAPPGTQFVFLEDATLAFENADDLENETAKKIFVDFFRSVGGGRLGAPGHVPYTSSVTNAEFLQSIK